MRTASTSVGKTHDVLIVGGGAAGMLAAVAASEAGARVLLLERNDKLGRKLYITGKGRCNVTNDCALQEFLANVPRNARFLYAALDAFPPERMMALLAENGCPVQVTRGGRVFPVSEKASDVTRALSRAMARGGVEVVLGARVTALAARGADGGVVRVSGEECTDSASGSGAARNAGDATSSGSARGSADAPPPPPDDVPPDTATPVPICGVFARVSDADSESAAAPAPRERFFPAATVVVATGGLSYPATGSTGDGYALLRAAGHRVTATAPALVPLACDDAWVTGLQGLSLRNVRLTLSAREGKGKPLFSEIGEMLFTHFGVSGPLVLTASSLLPDPSDLSGARLTLDLKPGMTAEEVDARLLRAFGEAGAKHVENVLGAMFPARLAGAVRALAGIAPDARARDVTRADRARLTALTKALELPVTRVRPFTEAVITRGGAEVRAFVPGRMASKRRAGLYAAGEVLDVDALTGGFNLQIAFATGYLAGRAAAAEALSSRE